MGSRHFSNIVPDTCQDEKSSSVGHTYTSCIAGLSPTKWRPLFWTHKRLLTISLVAKVQIIAPSHRGHDLNFNNNNNNNSSLNNNNNNNSPSLNNSSSSQGPPLKEASSKLQPSDPSQPQ